MNPRTIFVGWLSVLAALAGTITAYPMIDDQGDLIGDMLKIALVIGVGTAGLGALFWTVLQRRTVSPLRGALAGALTAACVVPLPLFAWALKADVSALMQADALTLGALVRATINALGAGLGAYVQVTKASLGAILLSAGLGYWVAGRSARPMRAG